MSNKNERIGFDSNGQDLIRGGTYTLKNRGETIYTLNGIYANSALVQAQKSRPIWADTNDLIKHIRGGYE